MDSNGQECDASGKSRLTNTADECSQNIGPTSSDGTTFEHSRSQDSSDQMLSVEDSHARTLATQTPMLLESTGRNLDCGLNTCELFANFNQEWLLLKTSKRLLFEDSVLFSEGLPETGTMLNGKLYLLGAVDRTTAESECLSLPIVPTPTASDGKGGHTPNAIRGAMHNLRDWFVVYYDLLYPPAVMAEYLMGFPIGWTDLRDSETL